MSNYPVTFNFLEKLNNKYVFFKKINEYIRENFNEDYFSFTEAVFERHFGEDEWKIDQAIISFIKYSNEYLILQNKLNKTGHYLYGQITINCCNSSRVT